jgi:hypothetical protein
VFITALITTAKLQNQPRCPPTDEGLRKCVVCIIFHMYMYIYIEYYFAIKNEIMSFAGK